MCQTSLKKSPATSRERRISSTDSLISLYCPKKGEISLKKLEGSGNTKLLERKSGHPKHKTKQ